MHESKVSGRMIPESEKHDLYFNLALEEVILELMPQSECPFILRFWRNPPSVVLGRSQELKEEVNEDFCKKHGIQIARRISGGGAVYHDEGNLNVSFFFLKKILPNGTSVKEINAFFRGLLIDSLSLAGIDGIRKEGCSNVFWKDRKISGFAGYQKTNHALHHATLLLDVDLNMLEGALLVKDPEPKHSRASKYCPTVNLAQLNLEEWKANLCSLIEERLGVGLESSNIFQQEEVISKSLCERMYSTREWIYFKKRVLLREMITELGFPIPS
ncbi:MAG: biotin/lipoate A/B protein ligase family protein [Candidatus Hodarchaeota archaeon]